MCQPGPHPGLHLRGAGPPERTDGEGRAGQPGGHVVVLLEQVGQVDLGREERRRDRAPERDHRRQPASYDERAGGQQRPHRDQHHHQRDRGRGVAERPSGSTREVEPDHGERHHRRQRQPATGGARRPASGRSTAARSAGSIAAVAASESATTPEEHPPPAGRLGHHTGHGRSDHRRDHPGGREGAEDARVVDGRVEARHQHVERDGHRAGAQSLQEPRRHEQLDRRRQPGQQQPEREHRRPTRAGAGSDRSGPPTSRPRPCRPRWPRA